LSSDAIWQRRDTPTFLDLRERHSVDIVQLADQSGVEPSVVYCMLLKRPVERFQAIQVLAGLSSLAGVMYGMDEVDIVVFDARGDCWK
jgi:hypothetical protein